MFIFAISLIVYSYSLFLLGLLHVLYPPVIFIWTLLFIIGSFFLIKFEKQKGWLLHHANQGKVFLTKKEKLFSYFTLVLIVLQCLINFPSVFMPETGFDALWYHLTLPKLYLLNHAIVHVPGGILYYTDMPKLIEMLYIFGLSFGGSFIPKLIHFLFGISILFLTYKVGRRFFSPVIALFAVLLFSTNLVWSWEMGSAYIDLGRTFFELIAFWSFLLWQENKKKSYFLFAAIFIGAAIASKLIALGSLLIFLVLLFIEYRKEQQKLFSKKALQFVSIALLIPLPWFIFAVIHTGDPFYPLFSSAYPVHSYWQILNPLFFVQSFWILFMSSPDPLSPVYVIALPAILFFWKKIYKQFPTLCLYALVSLIVWYITPQSGGGRFILPYLPTLSLLTVTLFAISVQKKWQMIIIASILFASCINIGYRGFIFKKDLPVLLGKETKQTYLTNNLAFNLGDFADTDNYFATHIKSTDMVLLYGFHNFYYVNFPFIDNSWVQSGDTFNYIAVQNGVLPKRFVSWKLVHINPITHVQLYSAGGLPWTY